MLWQFHSSLSRQVALATSATNADECRQNVAVCVLLSVSLVETFFNMFFRIVVSEVGFTQFSAQILQDFKNQVSLEYKIKEWPKLIFGKNIDFSQGMGQKFIQLKNMRNWLMHFTSTFESFSFDNITVQGLADISKYEALNARDAAEALTIAEGFIAELLKLRGVQPEHMPFQLQFWLGKG
jgi:hypothetical protein